MRSQSLTVLAFALGALSSTSTAQLPAAAATPPGGDSIGTSWTYASEGARFRVEVVARGLDVPFSLAFLPDGRMIVAERHRGGLSLVDARTGAVTPIDGLPPVLAQADSGRGMHEVALHPGYASNGWIYYVYTAAMEGGLHTQVVERARLRGTRFVDRERILVAQPAMAGGENHYGGRLVFHDGYVYVSTGDLDKRTPAQDLSSHHGKVLRIHDDGRVPADNPFVGKAGWKPEKFTLGHRNQQGAALHPVTGMLWTHEHGPQGGDEINVIRAGANYGWPVITYGVNYGIGTRIGEGTQKAGMAQPLHYWVPSIAPSGMAFYTGDRFTKWKGDLFVGSLKFQLLVRLKLDGEKVLKEERLLQGALGRIRDVRMGPDGFIYVVTDESPGVVARLEP